jgi:NAD(P)-dependent dehydrogenase (short-subunit alcohol dehydrogenase family)
LGPAFYIDWTSCPDYGREAGDVNAALTDWEREMRGLQGKVAVIAGGGTGIGAATAIRLAEEGVSVVVGDINIKAAEDVTAKIAAASGTAIPVRFDVSDDGSVRDLVNVAVETYGGIDLMHANAADLSLCLSDTDAVDLSLEIWDRTMAVNLRGHLLCTRHAIPALLKRGGGAIVYTSSGAAYVGEPERVAYAVSKSGINALMRHVASRWGKEGIRSNAIAPGLVMTCGSAGPDASPWPQHAPRPPCRYRLNRCPFGVRRW